MFNVTMVYQSAPTIALYMESVYLKYICDVWYLADIAHQYDHNLYHGEVLLSCRGLQKRSRLRFMIAGCGVQGELTCF
jgi:hypothetical protein